MEDNLKGDRPRLPLAALRLLVAPIRLVSAAVWQTVRQKVVADYGMLEEFVSTVTDMVPELLTTCQRAQLTLGLRARLILELCQFEASADSAVVVPHLDRMQTLIETWAGATNVQVPNSDFVDLVKTMLKDPEERENFFQKVFPEEFGPTFDEALHTLTWLLLSRLEKLLPLQTFQQVSSMFDGVSPVLEDCMESVSGCKELRIVLRYQRDLSQLDHSGKFPQLLTNPGSLDGACIISALKLPSIKKTTETHRNSLDCALPCAPDSAQEHLQCCTTQFDTVAMAEHHTSDTKTDATNRTPGGNETGGVLGGISRRKEGVCLLLRGGGVEFAPQHFKQCYVRLERLDMPPQPSPPRPVRRNRGLKMKKILLEEKRRLCDDVLPACKPASRKAKLPKKAPQEPDHENSINLGKDRSYSAPVSNCSEDESWSHYSDESSCRSRSPSVADSCPAENNSSSGCSNEDPPFMGPEVLSAPCGKPGLSDTKAQKKVHRAYCFVCKERVHTSLRTHMKTHFPAGDYACPRCDGRFKLFKSFWIHVRRTCYECGEQQVDPEKPDDVEDLYKCDKCHEAFRYRVSLDKHKLTHDELYCGVCRKVLRDAAALARHKSSHTPFQCTRCEETFALFMPLLRHCENVHKVSRPFKCNYCPKTSPKLRLLILHEWTHTGHLPFQCARCRCKFKSDSDLLHHERVHTKEKPYLCPECGKTFAKNSNLLRHMHLVHSESRSEKKHSCPQCEKSFKERGSLKKHQRSKHLHELFRHPCPDCGKMVSATTLARHKLMHAGHRPFKCTVPECDKYFRSNSEVKKHFLKQHTTERPHKCDVCGKGFISMCFLKAHAKIHSGEKPFVCHICGKAFPKRYSMERHKRLVHTLVPH